jgi:hypothetical protein
MKTGALKVCCLITESTSADQFPALSEALKADHGFNVESKAIRDLIEIMGDYDVTTRRAFLQFITGSPKLPIGGMICYKPTNAFTKL